ncbi:MAG TPA: hypothetical protein VKM36_10205 [Balneolaceae bacterium]|nr:hypothetical protein [Balneolaceae bacterium]
MTDKTSESLSRFLYKIIDYAGLFPPAELPLEQAVENYAEHRKSELKWMLSRFIIPAGLIPDLITYKDSFITVEEPFSLSVLGKKTDTIEEFQNEIDRVLEQVQLANRELKGYVTTDSFEIKLPVEAVESYDRDLLLELLNETATRFEQTEHAPSFLFYESVQDYSADKELEFIMEALSAHNGILRDENYHQTEAAGYKLRCGGTSENAFPPVELVLTALLTARDKLVPMKFTAGLHHPVRHFNESVNTKMHGFLNVFAAGLFSYAFDLNREEMMDILLEEDPESFQFTDTGLTFNGIHIETEEIGELRSNAFLSYGSCSFAEPVDDLKKLNLI